MRATPSLIALCAALAAPAAWAEDAEAEDCPRLPAEVEQIDSLEVYIEFNAADEDLGVHGGFGQSGWTSACIFDANGTLMVTAGPGGAFAGVGMADLFFEGREPTLDEWSYDQLKADFPEGEYRVEAITWDGKGVVGTTRFTTVVPSMPVITTPGFVADEEATEGADPISGDITVTWEPVSTSIDGRPVTIVGYELILTPGGEEHPEGHLRTGMDLELGPDVTSYTVPEGLLAPETPYEVEVLAVANDHNQTIGIKWFMTP